MWLNLNFSSKLMFNIWFEKLLLIENLQSNYKFRLLFSCKIDMSKFTSSKGFANFKVIYGPFFVFKLLWTKVLWLHFLIYLVFFLRLRWYHTRHCHVFCLLDEVLLNWRLLLKSPFWVHFLVAVILCNESFIHIHRLRGLIRHIKDFVFRRPIALETADYITGTTSGKLMTFRLSWCRMDHTF